jgi:uncharacterized protein YkwD
MAARDHCLDAGRNGLTSEIGSDYSSSYDRINRYGEAGWHTGEILAFHKHQSGIDTVMQLLMDDGIPDR